LEIQKIYMEVQKQDVEAHEEAVQDWSINLEFWFMVDHMW